MIQKTKYLMFHVPNKKTPPPPIQSPLTMLSKVQGNQFSFLYDKNAIIRTSLVVQWLRLCTPSAAGLGSIPAQGTRSNMP